MEIWDLVHGMEVVEWCIILYNLGKKWNSPQVEEIH